MQLETALKLTSSGSGFPPSPDNRLLAAQLLCLLSIIVPDQQRCAPAPLWAAVRELTGHMPGKCTGRLCQLLHSSASSDVGCQAEIWKPWLECVPRSDVSYTGQEMRICLLSAVSEHVGLLHCCRSTDLNRCRVCGSCNNLSTCASSAALHSAAARDENAWAAVDHLVCSLDTGRW